MPFITFALHRAVLILWYISSDFATELWPQDGATFESGAPLGLNVAYREPSEADYGAFEPAFHNFDFLGDLATSQNEMASGSMLHEMNM
ncbi:MAG TPA: hypothetical protein VGO47_04870 [Chlamydiales bacterium]|jgi:hypothetical protein|nr:hypothetical protein [Chlamydiales bacterium]